MASATEIEGVDGDVARPIPISPTSSGRRSLDSLATAHTMKVTMESRMRPTSQHFSAVDSA